MQYPADLICGMSLLGIHILVWFLVPSFIVLSEFLVPPIDQKRFGQTGICGVQLSVNLALNNSVPFPDVSVDVPLVFRFLCWVL